MTRRRVSGVKAAVARPATSAIEERARNEWRRNGVQEYLGRCDVCGRTRDEYTGRMLLVVRQRRRRQRECIHCWEARINGWGPLGNVDVIEPDAS